jgi:hypothetical protein
VQAPFSAPMPQGHGPSFVGAWLSGDLNDRVVHCGWRVGTLGG